MSNIEHLIENAIFDMERGVGYEAYVAEWPQAIMFPMVSATPDEIWEIAQYVITTYRDYILMEQEGKENE